MSLSIGSHHAIRIMLDLALHSDETPVFRHTISERQGISPDYIAQICRRLIKSGLLRSTMGPEGGYGLSKPASEIKIGEIIHSIEGPPPTSYCIAPGKGITCVGKENCTTHCFFLQLAQVNESYMNSVTLQDLCGQSEKLEHIISFEYTPHQFTESITTPSPTLDNSLISK